jgi:hypothetical protein
MKFENGFFVNRQSQSIGLLWKTRDLNRPDYTEAHSNTTIAGSDFVAHLKGKKSHEIIQRGLETLVNMTHRGAEGSDSKIGGRRRGYDSDTQGFLPDAGLLPAP